MEVDSEAKLESVYLLTYAFDRSGIASTMLDEAARSRPSHLSPECRSCTPADSEWIDPRCGVQLSSDELFGCSSSLDAFKL